MCTAATIRAARQVRYATAIPQNAFIGAGGRGASAIAWKRSPIDGGRATGRIPLAGVIAFA